MKKTSANEPNTHGDGEDDEEEEIEDDEGGEG